MSLPSNISKQLKNGLTELDMHLNTDALYFIDNLQNKRNIPPPDVWLALNQASKIETPPIAIYFKKSSINNYVPQIYIYDLSIINISEEQIAKIQRSLWTGQIAPLAYFFSDTFLKIVNCTEPINIKNNQIHPKYLEKELCYKEKIQGQTKMFAEVNNKLNQYKADKFDTGIFWEKSNIDFKKNSSLKNLLAKLKNLNNDLIANFKNKDIDTLQVLTIQCILIKYLEEKGAITENELLQFDNSATFYQILENKRLLSLFAYLNTEDKLNGRIFFLDENQRNFLINAKNQKFIYEKLLHFFDNKRDTNNQLSIWEEYDFKYLPVELISRIYEEFLVINKDKSNSENDSTKGIVYTPAHLARLLVDECMPVSNYNKVDVFDYKILDPACGSGIFLVTAYKRLVEWYILKERDRLLKKNEKKKTKKQETKDLQKILKSNIFGVDKEEKAVHITVFSLTLAFCELCNPTNTFVNDTHFDILKEENIITSDFFEWKNQKKLSFDLVVGNPPFYRDSKKFDINSSIRDKSIKIPNGQIALKFLTESIKFCKENGLQCLILPSPSVLYSNENIIFRTSYLKAYNIKQIFDFTGLSRNHVLWENKEPATLALFTENKKPDFNSNILHLTFRRTASIKDTFYFEFDIYDMFFVSRQEATHENHNWKSNLLGGNRISNLAQYYNNHRKLNNFLSETKNSYSDLSYRQGVIMEIPSIPNECFQNNKITNSKLPSKYNLNFKKNGFEVFNPPNLIIKKNIYEYEDKKYTIPIAINNNYFPFNDTCFGISTKNKNTLVNVLDFFNKNNDLIQFLIYLNSGRNLIYLNTAFVTDDLLNLPFIENQIEFSEIEQNIIDFVVKYQQEFIRHGENSIMSKTIKADEINSRIIDYSKGFETIINEVYQKKQFAFRITNAFINDDYVAVTFNYTNKIKQPTFILDKEKATTKIQNLFTHKINPILRSNRIIFNYAKDEVTIIKPNQLRYWLPFIGYRDADIVFADLVKAGY